MESMYPNQDLNYVGLAEGCVFLEQEEGVHVFKTLDRDVLTL